MMTRPRTPSRPMADAPKVVPEPTPAEEMAFTRERVGALVVDALILTDEGPTLDLDLLTRFLTQQAVPYRVMNREMMAAELSIVREEQNTQLARMAGSIVEQYKAESPGRLDALRAREKQILDQLWPINERKA